jgi:hypothetical protein
MIVRWCVVLGSLAHLMWLVPQKIGPQIVGNILTLHSFLGTAERDLPQRLGTALNVAQQYSFVAPVSGLILVGSSLVILRARRLALLVSIVPLLVSLMVYGSALSRRLSVIADAERAPVEVYLSGDFRNITILGRDGGAVRDCVSLADELARPISLCAGASWWHQVESLGDEFPAIEFWRTEVEGWPVIVSRIRVNHDLAPFGSGIVQLRRLSTFVRHHRGAVLLIVEGLPGISAAPTSGFYQQAAIRELALAGHFWRTVVGSFPIRLLGRGVRVVEDS